jgi:hypothetical protein
VVLAEACFAEKPALALKAKCASAQGIGLPAFSRSCEMAAAVQCFPRNRIAFLKPVRQRPGAQMEKESTGL